MVATQLVCCLAGRGKRSEKKEKRKSGWARKKNRGKETRNSKKKKWRGNMEGKYK